MSNRAAITVSKPDVGSRTHCANSRNDVTPVRLTITVTVLTAIAAALVPGLLRAEEEARWNALLLRLHSVRGKIEQFRQNHDGHLPAEGQNSADKLMRDLSRLLIADDDVVLTSGRSGTEDIQTLLLNPYTQKTGILVVPGELKRHHYSGSGRHGWTYSSTTGEFRSNLSPELTDRSGRLINQL